MENTSNWAHLDALGVGSIVRRAMEREPQTTESAKAELERELAQDAEKRLRVMKAMGVPYRHARKVTTCERRPILDDVDDWMESDQWLMMMSGPTDHGKSFAAAYWLWRRAAKLDPSRPVGGAWYHASDLPAMERNELLQMRRGALLVIDDLGSEYYTDSGWFISRLYGVLADRYDNERQTLITTNFNGKQIADRYADERLLRRIRGEGPVDDRDVKLWGFENDAGNT